MSIRLLAIAIVLWSATAASTAKGGVIIGNEGLSGGWRWDAVPKVINGNERSLAGGLRYSVQGGSFVEYRDLFQWVETPPADQFQVAVEQAFAAWTTIDPATGLHSSVAFVADLATSVVGSGMFAGLDSRGAEIDLLGLDAGDARTRAIANLDIVDDDVSLTTGATNYAGSAAIAGVDITLNNNSGARYTLDFFRRLLTHEIGHALGFNDVENAIDEPRFIDDNFDDSTSARIVETLNNSWALSINPLNPADSPLALHQLANGDPGNDTPGVDLLMESVGLGIAIGNPTTSLVPLTNDEYATRQFLYPSLERDVVVTGDYNGNGIVDAADYVVWRDSFGKSVFWPGDKADGDQSGTIDSRDFEFWKMRFGDVILAAPAKTTAAVAPEPPTWWLAACCLALASTRREWRR